MLLFFVLLFPLFVLDIEGELITKLQCNHNFFGHLFSRRTDLIDN